MTNPVQDFNTLDPSVQLFLLKIAPKVRQFFETALTKKCSRCGETKTVAHFNRRMNKSAPGRMPSFMPMCKECTAIESRRQHTKYRREYPEKHRARKTRDHAIKTLMYGTTLIRSDIPVELIELAVTRLSVIQEIKRLANEEIKRSHYEHS